MEDSKNLVYDDIDLLPRMAVINLIDEVDHYSQDPFKELGFIDAIKLATWIIFHPFLAMRFSANNVSDEIKEKILNYKPISY